MLKGLVHVLDGSSLGVHRKRLSNEHLFRWFVLSVAFHHAHVGDHFHALSDATEDCVLAVQPLRRRQCDEKLWRVLNNSPHSLS